MKRYTRVSSYLWKAFSKYTLYWVLEDRKILISLSVEDSHEHSFPSMSHTPPFNLRNISQRISRLCANFHNECVTCSDVSLSDPVPKDDMCCMSPGPLYVSPVVFTPEEIPICIPLQLFVAFVTRIILRMI